jgi:hypothetical protein
MGADRPAVTQPRPPRDITADGFFRDWLPGVFASEFGAGKRTASEVTVAVHLEGEGGGDWTLDVRDGVLSLRDGGEGMSPLVTLRQTVQNWRALAVGEPGSVDLAPPQASPLDVLFVDPASRQIMQAVRGTLRFEVENYNQRTWWMLVKFGQQAWADPPDATITLDAETYAQMLSRELSPPEAYFAGKISLDGDRQLALQLAVAMLPRFV